MSRPEQLSAVELAERLRQHKERRSHPEGVAPPRRTRKPPARRPETTRRPQTGGRREGKSHWKFTEAEARTLHARHVQGETVKKLAAEQGVTEVALSRNFKRFGLPVIRRGMIAGKRNPPPERVAEIIQQHSQGRTWKSLAREEKLARCTLRQIVKEMDTQDLSALSRQFRCDWRFTEAEVRALHARHVNGETVKKLAAEQGVDNNTLNRNFKRFSLPIIRRWGGFEKRTLPPERVSEIVEQHSQGRTWESLACEENMVVETLRRIVKEMQTSDGT